MSAAGGAPKAGDVMISMTPDEATAWLKAGAPDDIVEWKASRGQVVELSVWKGTNKKQDGVKLDADLHVVIEQTMAVAATHEKLYQKSGKLVCVESEDNGRVKLITVSASRMQEMLSECSRWLKPSKKDKDYTQVDPPEKLAEAMVNRGSWEHIRPLRSVTAFPILSPRGALYAQKGYASEVKAFYAGNCAVDVPQAPTRDDAEQAINILFDIVCDFPFADAAHRSAWLAALLSVLSRFAHDGNIPLVVIQANTARAGKTKLVEIISHIVNGKAANATTQPKNEEEERKRITSTLLGGPSLVLIDNVVATFGGQNINALITSRDYGDRNLGKLELLELENTATWFVTANNVMLAPDTAQRSLHIRLQSDHEKPQDRDGFKYPSLIETVKERRAELLGAALTILKAYIVAGKPDMALKPWGSFEEWSRLVRGAIVWCGLPDPALTRVELEDECDAQAPLEHGLVEGWGELLDVVGKPEGITAKEALDFLADKNDGCCSTLREALATIAVHGKELPTVNKLGASLRKFKNLNRGGKMLKDEGSEKFAKRWYVHHLKA